MILFVTLDIRYVDDVFLEHPLQILYIDYIYFNCDVVHILSDHVHLIYDSIHFTCDLNTLYSIFKTSGILMHTDAC